jgi:hypothetical protein
MKKIFLIPLIVSLAVFAKVKFTHSVFSDTEKIIGNTIRAGVWSGDTLLKSAGVLGVSSTNGIEIHFFKTADGKAIGFTVSGDDVSTYKTYSYTITYDADGIIQGIKGTGEINGQSEFTVENLDVATCSSDGTCVYHAAKDLKLSLDLRDENGAVEHFDVK